MHVKQIPMLCLSTAQVQFLMQDFLTATCLFLTRLGLWGLGLKSERPECGASVIQHVQLRQEAFSFRLSVRGGLNRAADSLCLDAPRLPGTGRQITMLPHGLEVGRAECSKAVKRRVTGASAEGSVD